MIFLAGISSFITALQYIWKTQITGLLDKHLDIVLGYLSISGLFSFVFVYWYGAPQNPRTLDIVKWVIQVSSIIQTLFMEYYSVARENKHCYSLEHIVLHISNTRTPVQILTSQ